MNSALHHPPRPRRDNWCTPESILIPVRKVFGGQIGLDPCANTESVVNAKVEFCLPDHDGLVEPWTADTVYVNPPYGRKIGLWLERCLRARRDGAEVIALLPATPDTEAWRKYVQPASCVCFVHGRLTFLGAPAAAPNPTAIVYWGRNWHRFAELFGELGGIWRIDK